MKTVARGTTFFFRVQGLVEYAWEQEGTGLNFKRPLMASWTEQEENFGDTQGDRQLLAQSVVCGGIDIITGQLVRNENLGSHPRPKEPEYAF